MKQRIYGDGMDRCVVASSYHQLGMVAQDKGCLNDAERWYRQSLEMKQRLHDDDVDHPDVASFLHELGRVMQSKDVWTMPNGGTV